MVRVSAVLAGVLSLLLAGAPPEAPTRLLLDAAVTAKARRDKPKLEWCLRAWASLGGTETAPLSLAAEVAAAREWALRLPPLRAYGSRLPDRIRVGLEDPASVVGRVIVTVREAGVTRQLIQEEGHAEDRLEYHLESALGPDAEIRIALVMTKLGGEVVVREAVLAAAADLPALPAFHSKTSTAAAAAELIAASTHAASEGPRVPWWWIAGAAVAAGMVAAALWQETRF
jgi:hypothetical protein